MYLLPTAQTIIIEEQTLPKIQIVDKFRGLEIEKDSCRALFTESLRKMTKILKHGAGTQVSHYDCTMRIKLNAVSTQALLLAFLNRIIRLTEKQQTLFVYTYIEELTETRINAQVYGVWFDKLDQELKSIDKNDLRVRVTKKGKWACSIHFQLKGAKGTHP